MSGRHMATIRVKPGSELDQLLATADDTEILFEKEGARYRLYRVAQPGSLDSPRLPRHQAGDSERVLEIIGIGALPAESNVARHKDQYLADAADHRGFGPFS